MQKSRIKLDNFKQNITKTNRIVNLKDKQRNKLNKLKRKMNMELMNFMKSRKE